MFPQNSPKFPIPADAIPENSRKFPILRDAAEADFSQPNRSRRLNATLARSASSPTTALSDKCMQADRSDAPLRRRRRFYESVLSGRGRSRT
jgi:hypothetical protein